MKKKFVKRLLTTLAACAMAIGIGTTAMAAQYGDVKEGAWYYDSVQYVSDKGLMTGYASGNFGPADGLTRGQFATILYRMSGSPVVTYESFFPDVPNGVFYSEAVVWAKNAGVITGYAGGNFGPQDPITREMMATILYRYEGSPGADQGLLASFPDSGNVSGFAKDGIAWAIGNAIITGDQGKINPQGRALRAHCATILYRYLEGNSSQGGSEGGVTDDPDTPSSPETDTWARENGWAFDGARLAYTKAADGVCYVFDEEGKTIHADADKDASGDIMVRDSLDGYPITSVNFESFSANERVTSLDTPEAAGMNMYDWAKRNEFTCSSTEGYEKTVDGVVYFCYLSIDGYTILIDDGSAASGKVEIPAEFDGIPVTFIGGNSFGTNKNITEIVIPGSVTEIHGYAFNQCSNLKSFTFQGGVPEGFNRIIGINGFTVYYPKDVAEWSTFEFLLADKATLVAY